MKNLARRYLADSLDEKNAIGDYSSLAKDFFITPPSKTAYLIHSLTVTLEASNALTPSGYGATAALTNGVNLILARPAEQSFLDGILIKNHYQWLGVSAHQHADSSSIGGSSSPHFFIARLKFDEPILLSGKYAQQLIVRLNDDFSGLDSHRFFAEGCEVSE